MRELERGAEGERESFFFSKFIFIYFEREIESKGGGAEREGDRIPSRLCAVSSEPDAGLEPMNHEIMT